MIALEVRENWTLKCRICGTRFSSAILRRIGGCPHCGNANYRVVKEGEP
jgi:predicted  nucleic acid-binding Zn-ribbon protein